MFDLDLVGLMNKTLSRLLLCLTVLFVMDGVGLCMYVVSIAVTKLSTVENVM